MTVPWTMSPSLTSSRLRLSSKRAAKLSSPPPLVLPAAPRTRLRGCVQEQLEVGVRKHDRAGVAPLGHHAAAPGQPALEIEQRHPHLRPGAHLRGALPHLGLPDGVRDVALAEQ